MMNPAYNSIDTNVSSTGKTSCCSRSRCCGPKDPVTREVPKVGRNTLCPCHSGKKFKKCCGK